MHDRSNGPRRAGKVLSAVAVPAVLLVVGVLGYAVWRPRAGTVAGPHAPPPPPVGAKSRYAAYERFTLWLGEVSPPVRARALATGAYSNIEPEDYTKEGPAACAGCHAVEFKAWSQHSHRWMNATAVPEHVKGDFSDRVRCRYLGGEGRFWREGGRFRMAAQRGPLRREFRITRTIGSRYFQYYVGVQTAGPEPPDDPRYRTEHVLPFGYWLTKKEWVPTVHIREDRADDYDDPKLNPYEDFYFRDYDQICAGCHTTWPTGDWLLRVPDRAGHYSPYRFGLNMTRYLERQRPGLLPAPAAQVATADLEHLMTELIANRPPARILHLGIVCEACHNGCRQHAADAEHFLPHFFPTSPLIYAELPRDNPHGRTHANLNWICARCHVGIRPQFPGGMTTWNSAEYSDAVRGSCYSQLRCVDCHEPHHTIGPVWSHTAEHDDGLCLRCHASYREAAARRAHTHHAPASDGDRCMNCHMPRVNEGLDTVVRTHLILSPTWADIIEHNGPNACNLCHLDRPIDWTLGYLRDWYGRTYKEDEIARSYPERQEAVGRGWLSHPFRATRLVAAAAYARRKTPEAPAALLPILDDRYLLNRQFGQLAVESVSGRPLTEWGYRFTLSPEERGPVLRKVRQALVPDRH